MKILIAVAISMLSLIAHASDTYFDLNLTKIEDMTNYRKFDFSLTSLCGKVECEGLKLTIPTSYKISIGLVGNANCAIQRSSSTQFEGGDTYLISAYSAENSGAACEVVIKDKTKLFTVINIVNEKAGTGGGASISN